MNDYHDAVGPSNRMTFRKMTKDKLMSCHDARLLWQPNSLKRCHVIVLKQNLSRIEQALERSRLSNGLVHLYREQR